ESLKTYQEDLDLQKAIIESLKTYQEDLDLQKAIAESLKDQYKTTPIIKATLSNVPSSKKGISDMLHAANDVVDAVKSMVKVLGEKQPTKESKDHQNGKVGSREDLLGAIQNFNKGGLKKVSTNDRSGAKAQTELTEALQNRFKEIESGNVRHVETDDRSAPVLGGEIDSNKNPQSGFAQELHNRFAQLREIPLNKVKQANDRSAPVFNHSDMNPDNQKRIAMTLKGEQAAKDHVVTRVDNSNRKRIDDIKVRFVDSEKPQDMDLRDFIAQQAHKRHNHMDSFQQLEAQREARQQEWMGLPDPDKKN
ncbi:MAG TPA: WH2 domain-containing protein, partial [Candidatus Nitrosotenuis sp.]|nr:WH2 domain-containing protein [Candidatus Nitrosotenuis sp.]